MILIKNTRKNMQVPNTKIANWLKDAPAAPWTTLGTLAASSSLALQATWPVDTPPEVQAHLTAVATAAVAYADAKYGPTNPNCIEFMVAQVPNPMAADAVEYIEYLTTA